MSKTTFVTGTSSGFGAITVRALADAGHTVYVCIYDGDRGAFMATLSPDATLTDDGNPASVAGWIDREISPYTVT